MAAPSATDFALPGLKDKVVIVTGSSSGLGLATAQTLLASSAKVFGVDISPIHASLSSNSNFSFLQCNLTQPNAPADVVKACTEAFGGRIDVLLNVAGIMDLMQSADTLQDDDWDKVIAINLTAPVKLMREVLPVMQKQGSGAIVNVSSKAGMSGGAAGIAYTASKHGLIGATKNVAWRFHDEGIRCNAICPGAIDTNIGKDVDYRKMDLQAHAKLKPVVDIHFAAEKGAPPPSPVLIANMMVYLASDLSIAVNGAIIPVDQGWSTI